MTLAASAVTRGAEPARAVAGHGRRTAHRALRGQQTGERPGWPGNLARDRPPVGDGSGHRIGDRRPPPDTHAIARSAGNQAASALGVGQSKPRLSTQVCHWAAAEPFPKADIRRAASPAGLRPIFAAPAGLLVPRKRPFVQRQPWPLSRPPYLEPARPFWPRQAKAVVECEPPIIRIRNLGLNQD